MFVNIGTHCILYRDSYNIDWNTMPAHFKYGTVLKREQFSMESKEYNKVATRVRVVSQSFDITFSAQNVDYVMRKYN